MHCRALGHITSPISPWALGRAISFTPTPQTPASRAWAGHISPHSKPSQSAGKCLILSSHRLNRTYGGPNLTCGFSSDMPVKRDFTTKSLDSVLHPVVLEKQSERTPGMRLCPTIGYAVYSTAGPHSTDEFLSNTSEASRNGLSSNNDVYKANGHPVDPSESSRLEKAIDVYHYHQTQVTDTQQASATTTIQAPISTQFPKPTSIQTLYENLRHALGLKSSQLVPALIDYHDSFPKYRSTQSYNLLIEFAMRRSQFGTAHWLLDAMDHDQLPRNATTNRLAVRWLVRTGKWDLAWTQVTGLTPNEALHKLSQNASPPYTIPVPCELWMELLGTVKRGAIRRPRNVRWGTDGDGKWVRLPNAEVVEEPNPGTEAYSRKRQLLACLRVKPNRTASPQLIKAAVSMALRNGQRSVAEALTGSLLSRLPSLPEERVIAQCMGIIHILLAADIENGVRSYYANRRLLSSLLRIHPHLAPTSKTVQLILAPLKRARNSGAIAIAAVKDFQEDWGEEIINDKVRGRVVKLTKKQGRIDIVEEMYKIQERAILEKENTSTPAILRKPGDQ